MKIEFEILYIIFEIPILTVEIIQLTILATVKIGISNIIESQTLSSSCLGSFLGFLFTFLKLTIFLNLLVSLSTVVLNSRD